MFVGVYIGQDNVVFFLVLECIDIGYFDFLWLENVCVNIYYWFFVYEILMLQF